MMTVAAQLRQGVSGRRCGTRAVGRLSNVCDGDWSLGLAQCFFGARVQVFDPVDKKFVIKTWADVRVGDIITVFKVSGPQRTA